MDISKKKPLITDVHRCDGDFARPGSAQPYSGSCCCCCLHMVGAAVVGLAGIPIGWVTGVKRSKRPLHPKVNLVLAVGLVSGILLVLVGIAMVIGMFDSNMIHYDSPVNYIMEAVGVAVLFGPLLVFLPVYAVMLFSTWLLSRIASDDKPDVVQRVYCRSCQYDLRASLDSQTCPECGVPVVKEQLMGYAFGLAVAWRISWMSFIMAGVGTGLGYLVMIPCAGDLF
jgi:hypothetical protein